MSLPSPDLIQLLLVPCVGLLWRISTQLARLEQRMEDVTNRVGQLERDAR